MEHLEGKFKGVKGLNIYWQAWLPEKPKAVVQIIHGFAEHSGRYMNVVNELVPKGYAVYANDHRGHGKSEGKINYVDSWDQFVEDERIFNAMIRKTHPDLPIFILGHSMGSGIAIYFTERYEGLVHGLILSGTGTSAGGEVSGFLKTIASVMSKLAKKMSIDPKLDPSKLSHDAEVVKAYIEDPLVHHTKITTRLGFEMLKAFENAPNVVKEFKLPVLVQRGTEDKAMGGFDKLKEAFTTPDLEIHEYEGLFHEVYNETEKERARVLRDLSNWLESHVKR